MRVSYCLSRRKWIIITRYYITFSFFWLVDRSIDLVSTTVVVVFIFASIVEGYVRIMILYCDGTGHCIYDA